MKRGKQKKKTSLYCLAPHKSVYDSRRCTETPISHGMHDDSMRCAMCVLCVCVCKTRYEEIQKNTASLLKQFQFYICLRRKECPQRRLCAYMCCQTVAHAHPLTLRMECVAELRFSMFVCMSFFASQVGARPCGIILQNRISCSQHEHTHNSHSSSSNSFNPILLSSAVSPLCIQAVITPLHADKLFITHTQFLLRHSMDA